MFTLGKPEPISIAPDGLGFAKAKCDAMQVLRRWTVVVSKILEIPL